MKILGIHYGHNATVAYLESGQIKACVSEERFNRLKNSTGWPELALNYIKKNYAGDFDLAVMSQRYPWGFDYLKRYGFESFAPGARDYAAKEKSVPLKIEMMRRLFPGFFYRRALKKILMISKKAETDKKGLGEMQQYFSEKLALPPEKIIFADHHLCHSLSADFFLENPAEKTLVFTLDGEGDGLCATVGVLQNGQIEILSKVNRAFSLGYLYLSVTSFLGMKPNEHEFKVMGLAPYAKKEHTAKLLPIFEKILWLNDKDEFESRIPMPLIKYYLRDQLVYQRFDNIAGAIQEFTENIVSAWVSRWVARTGLKRVALAGGVFMNVKLNQRVSQLPAIASLTVVPSAADETTALGAVAFGIDELAKKNNVTPEIKSLNDLYLGSVCTDREIENWLGANDYFKKYKIVKPVNINKEIAGLLAANQVAARFAGPMEFGARALGNRSILANPSSYDNVKIINEMIKNRDFWMPFAATILKEDAGRYLINPKNVDGSFMAITFDTTVEAQKDLAAAIHPYDKTSRPQVLERASNTGYYELIEEFKKITGIGGVLNTSFNLHGEPNVCGLEDAMRTLADSGLRHLALGPFLISKK